MLKNKWYESSIFCFVAETINSLANTSYGYQIMKRTRHAITNCLHDGKTHMVINRGRFQSMGSINFQLFELEFVMSEFEIKQPINVGFPNLREVKLRLLELYYNLFDK